MAEETKVIVSQAEDDTDEKPQAGAAVPQAGAAGEGATEEEELIPKSRLTKANNEAKNLRERLKAYEAKEQEKLPEQERTQKLLEAVEKERDELRAQIRDAKIEQAAAKANALHADVVAKLVPADTDLDEIDSAIKAIHKKYPALFKATNPDGGVRGPQRMAGDMNDLIRGAVGK